MNIYTSETEFLKAELQRLRALVRAQQITIDKLEAQPEQEPVAWMFQHEETGRTMCVDAQQVEWGFEKGNPRLKKIASLYTSPPQRKPLTDEEVVKMDEWLFDQPFWRVLMLVRAIEAAHGIKGEA